MKSYKKASKYITATLALAEVCFWINKSKVLAKKHSDVTANEFNEFYDFEDLYNFNYIDDDDMDENTMHKNEMNENDIDEFLYDFDDIENLEDLSKLDRELEEEMKNINDMYLNEGEQSSFADKIPDSIKAIPSEITIKLKRTLATIANSKLATDKEALKKIATVSIPLVLFLTASAKLASQVKKN
ncbi:MAG: hypothetical protein ATN31_07080 [Candidatus Epulonipiscioides saccharophilum]|nr:MAG: hypothetical protein ATN31_07080 [Epulopiscium sp. AS2M-Bin001]